MADPLTVRHGRRLRQGRGSPAVGTFVPKAPSPTTGARTPSWSIRCAWPGDVCPAGFGHSSLWHRDRAACTRGRDRLKEVELVKTWFVVGSAAAVTAVGVALLAGIDDIRRFRRMRKM